MLLIIKTVTKYMQDFEIVYFIGQIFVEYGYRFMFTKYY